MGRGSRVQSRGLCVQSRGSWVPGRGVAGRPTKTQRVYGVLNKSLRVVSGQGVGQDGY